MSYSLDQLETIFRATEKNILVIDDVEKSKNGKKKKIAAVYFSSLMIITPPKDVDSFVANIIKKDRYEWFGTRFEDATRHVFVRDLYMLWYQSGISSQNDTVDKVAAELRKLTEGYDSVCVGSSAGGYAAMLFAKLIGSKACIAFSPRIDISRVVRGYRATNPKSECWQQKYDCLMEAPGKYNNLMELYRDNEMPVYAYFPVLSPLDNIELEDARKIPSIRLFLHKSDVHGHTFSSMVVEKLINAVMRGEVDYLYKGIELNDAEIALHMNVSIDEVAAARKGFKHKLRKYKCKNFMEYVLVAGAYKICKVLFKFLRNKGLRVD